MNSSLNQSGQVYLGAIPLWPKGVRTGLSMHTRCGALLLSYCVTVAQLSDFPEEEMKRGFIFVQRTEGGGKFVVIQS